MNNQYRWGIVAVLAVIALALFWYISRPTGPDTASTATPTSSSTSQGSTSTTPGSSPINQPASSGSAAINPPTKTSPIPFALVQGDVVKSWSFQGAYTGNAQLTEKAMVDIQKFTVLLPTGTIPKYELYMSIANQYDLLGDGAKEFEYLNKALALDSTTTGLAWDNMGNLLSRLGANLSARVAFRNAIKAQPFPQYAQDFLQFLVAKFPQDTADMTEAQKILVPAHNAQ